MMNQIKTLTAENKLLAAALKEAQDSASLRDRLTELERQLAILQKQQIQDANLLKGVVHMDALRGLVFWHSLGTAITGIDYITAYANEMEMSSGPTKAYTDDGQERKLIEKLPESSVSRAIFQPGILSSLKL
ncbi:hypothetical protein PHET_02320 [Paragonimus heterotremus]|uniref:Uncharacterized protein n=1 Tax=Paragonimus heterotremus TaxID=100268 RepID=A0A8J4TQ97_9TREM|nr:hypothetical protein PHET_02320 [Paragonimus heterotremus]